MTLRKWFYFLCAGAIVLGLFLRFYNLSESGMFFYDEGFYLHHNLSSLEFIQAHAPRKMTDIFMALVFYLHTALASGKSLWFFVMDSRFFFGGLHDWTIPKMLAACFGVGILPLVWLFARRYYGSRDVAILAVGLTAILPGMVFYSRIGLQEAFSTCLVLSGLYFYLYPRAFGWKTFLSSFLLAAAFFSNYRLLMLPTILLAVELWEGWVLQRGFQARKLLWCSLMFFSMVILVGNLLGGANTQIIGAWVFHQEDMARQSFSWVNFLSHPFYFFLLETVLFAGILFLSIVFFWRQWKDKALPLFLLLVQMIVFSITSEKGARYLCVMLPFAVMSVSYTLMMWFRFFSDNRRLAIAGLTVVMGGLMVVKSSQLAMAHSDYQAAIESIDKHAPGALILSTQDQVQSLYVHPYKRVQPVPPRFDMLLKFYNQGYRYMVIDPQVYVGLTTKVRFEPELRDYLLFIETRLSPVMVLPHMNHVMLERFVCEHSENLVTSIRFLFSKDVEKYASIRIYDINGLVPQMNTLYLQLLKNRK